MLIWHRRARKTSTALEKIALEAFNVPNKIYWIVYPTKTQAKEAIWKDPNMLFRIIRPEMVERQNEIELTLYLKGGSILILKGADEPDTLRGNDPYGIIFDEFDTMKYEAWGILEPVIRANGGWAWFIGTFKGKRHLWQLKQKGQSDNPEWKSWVLKASTSGVIAKDQLEQAKESMTQALFNQEFECEPIEGEGAVFKGVGAIMTAVPRGPIEEHTYTVGVDLGKYEDYTVISVFDRANNSQVYRDRFRNQEWRYVKGKIREISKHYNKALVTVDSTGLGDPIYEDLGRMSIPVEAFKFTQQSKKDLIDKLQIWIELKRVKLILQPEVQDEYDNYSYELTPEGRTKYGAPDGFHDDIVTADALGVWNLQQIYVEQVEKPKTLIQEHYEQAKKEERGEDVTIDGYTNELDEWAGA